MRRGTHDFIARRFSRRRQGPCVSARNSWQQGHWDSPALSTYLSVSAEGAAPLEEDTDRSSVGLQPCSDPAGWLQVDLRPGPETGSATRVLTKGQTRREPQLAILSAIYHRGFPGAAARLSTGPVLWNSFDSRTTQSLKQLQIRGAGTDQIVSEA
jgi:hypothetical protein